VTFVELFEFDGELSELARGAATGFDIFWCLPGVGRKDGGTGSVGLRGALRTHVAHSHRKAPSKHGSSLLQMAVLDEITYGSSCTCALPTARGVPSEEDASSSNSTCSFY
jgi:hypothetical protein